MPILRLALACLLVSTWPLAQQSTIPDGVRAAAERITADQLARDLGYLASDELLGRNTPSPGFDAAADYIAKRLERAGLKPAGDSGTFFQRYLMAAQATEALLAGERVDGAKLIALGDTRDYPPLEAITRTVFAAAWMFANSSERPRIDKSIPPTVPRYR